MFRHGGYRERQNLVEVMKYIEDFLNGPLADKDAKARCEELIEARGEVDC